MDLGSVSVKAALYSRDRADAPFFEQNSSHPLFQSVRRLSTPGHEECWLAVTRYARIAGNPLQQTRSLLEKLMLDVMYEVPSSDDILHVNITQAVVTGHSKPLIRRKHGRAAA